jgi:hypothetical protein
VDLVEYCRVSKEARFLHFYKDMGKGRSLGVS